MNRDIRAQIGRNVASVRARIAAACARSNRNVSDVTLVAVTKSVGLIECEALLDLGVRELGENRVEDAESKIAALGNRARWHMIGSIQKRKVPRVVERFDRVDSVDRLDLAKALNHRAGKLGRRLPILLQANVSGESSKHGFAPNQMAEALKAISALEYLSVEGLMTMAPFEASPEETRPVFKALAALAAEHGLKTLSMGMTNDFEVAIEEGATEVRIGTALFKKE